MQDRFVATRRGRIHVLEGGAGPALILLHTNGTSAHEYRFIADKLAVRHHVIAWDQPGQGDSDPLTTHWSVGDYADAVVALMDALDLRKADVFGASIGGMISVDLGQRYAERVDHLFVVEPPYRTAETWAKTWANTENNFTQVVHTMEQFGPRVQKPAPDMLARWNIDRSKAGARTMIDVMWALREYDALAALPRVAAKTRLIYGEKSNTSASAPLLQQHLKEARMTIMRNCGHYVMIDDPTGVVALIDEFVFS